MDPRGYPPVIRIPSGAVLIDKPAGISSFGVIDKIQKHFLNTLGIKRRDLPKIGHGGTLDPFATGLLVICLGKAVKLARYFLGSPKSYEGTFLFGQTTMPGDPTMPVTETSENLPKDLESLQSLAHKMTQVAYEQVPPMYSAKKKDGKPLYEFARAGIEVEREPKIIHLYQFDVLNYENPRSQFQLRCSSGTYVRTLAQDFARLMGGVGMLETLRRTASGSFQLGDALTPDELLSRDHESWPTLKCWIPFDRLLDSYDRATATDDEYQHLSQGRQNVLFNILKRTTPSPAALTATQEHRETCIAIYHQEKLVAIARQTDGVWGLERVFSA